MSSAKATVTDPWDIVTYEVQMFFELCRLLAGARHAAVGEIANNAMVESACLHARVLIDILRSKTSHKGDDIRMDDLLPGFRPPSLDKLDAAYGDGNTPGTPCWTLNKMIMHPTIMRGSSHDYTNLLNRMLPLIQAVWQEVDARHPTRGTASLASSTHGVYPGLSAKTSS